MVGYLVVACLGNGDLLKEAREFGGFSSLFLASLSYGGISHHMVGNSSRGYVQIMPG